MSAGEWLGIPRDVLDDEDRTEERRLTTGDVCGKPVDGIPGACVRPPDHGGRCYRLATYAEA